MSTPAPAQSPEPQPLGGRRRVLHALLVALGWVLFVWSWRRVTAGSPEAGELRALMVAAAIVVPVLTLSWVAHNVGIHRRKGPRRSLREVQAHYDRDFNGRVIDADWTRLADARRITIVLDGGHKRYVAGADPRRAAPMPVTPGTLATETEETTA